MAVRINSLDAWRTKLEAIVRRGLPSLRNALFAQFGFWPASSLSGHWLTETPVYCINLRRAVWRRQLIQKQVEKIGLKRFWFIDGVDASSLDFTSLVEAGLYSSNESRRWHANGLTLAEIACSLSHAECYRQIILNGHSHAVILEDDALFRTSRLQKFNRDDVPEWADIVFLNAFLSQPRPVDRIGTMLFKDTSYNGSSAAYMLSLNTAQKLLAEAVPVIHAADGLLGRALAHVGDASHQFRQKGSALALRGVLVHPEVVTNGSTEHYVRSSIR